MSVAFMAGVTSCHDDLDYDDPNAITDGTGRVRMAFDFMPLAETTLDSRASTVAPDGDAIKAVTDLCILIYDRQKKLVEIKEYDASELGLKLENRTGADATNGVTAEAQTWHGEVTFDLKYGKYYIYAVANLGKYSKTTRVSTTRQVLEENREEIETVDGLRALRVEFDAENVRNNCEMLGYFTNGKAEHAPVSAESDGVIVNQPQTQLHSWLRRCASKVTIDFDPSGLNENVRIFIRRATVRDIPVDCPLGFTNVPDDKSQLLRIKGNTYGENASGHHIDFGDFLKKGDKEGTQYDSQSTDYMKWPMIMKADTLFPVNAHSETAKCLILYENMQGFGKDKRQYPDKDGLVADRDIVKDNKPYGSYIEVEAYYQNLNAGQLSQGKIIYRFMLGQNVIDDYNAMRNCHYKLTLAFRGNANDADWHIVYPGTDPVVVPTPYYISYLYNHEMRLPLRMTPENPDDKITKLEAQITINRWWPEGGDKRTYFSDGKCDIDNDANRANGFLSLKPTVTTNVQPEGGLGAYNYNKPYYYGERDGINKSIRTEYPVDKTRQYTFTSKITKESRTDEVTVQTTPGSNSIEWGIPLYTRAKSLVIATGYTGNNVYSGHYRLGKVLFTATLNGDKNKTMKKEVEIRQVERIVNPKGVYRKWDSREPFHVVLKKLREEDSEDFDDVRSDGPWRAYIVAGDKDFIDIGRPGNKTAKGSSGSAIDFNIRFKGSGGANISKNCVIRVEYNNYTCVHLIFVRQGYAAVPIVDGGSSWHVTNMLGKGVPAGHPCDEGSMFKFGNWDQPIDVGAITQPAKAWPDMEETDFISRADELDLYGGGKAKWTGITFEPKGGGFSEDGGKVADMADISKLVGNCEIGFGVLYADGATETAGTVSKAYGYNRAKGQTTGYGMRGAFTYNAKATSTYFGRNLFFPIGHSGYGQRKDINLEHGSGKDGVLRYAAGRYKMMDDTEATNRPLLWDLFRRFGAIYWSRTASSGQAGLDINYFSFDFNTIDAPNIIYIDGGKYLASNACFVRCVD